EGGKPAIGLGVSMQDGANIIALGQNLKRAMAAVTAALPVGIEVQQIADQPNIVEHSVSEFAESFVEALGIVLLVSFLSLGWRTGTLVTAAGFLPVGFANSSAGEYAGGIFWIVSLALVASWFVAVVFTPYLGLKLLPDFAKKRGAHGDPQAIYDTRIYRALRRLIEASLRRRRAVIAVTGLLFAAAVAGFPLVQQQFFPTSTRTELSLEMRLPEGTAIGVTDATARKAERLIGDDPDVVTYTTYVRQGSPRFWLGLNPVLPTAHS